MIKVPQFEHMRYGRLMDQPLTIMNQGPDSEGFTICGDCGAAVPGNDEIGLQRIPQPSGIHMDVWQNVLIQVIG